MQPDVTIVSIFHNRASSVRRSVQSIVEQTGANYRILLIDDGSKDETLAELQRFASDKVEVRHQKNCGFTQTLINTCNDINTEFVAIHGAGDESLPTRIARQVELLKANPNIVGVGCGILNIDEVSGSRWSVVPHSKLIKGPYKGDFGISHGELMFRQSAYLKVGGYRNFFKVGQASDLYRRLSRVGDFGYIEDILYHRFLLADGVNADAKKLAQRNILAAISSAAHRNAIAHSSEGGASLKDELDAYGILYPYFAAKDPALGRTLSGAALMLWATGDRTLGLRLAGRSIQSGAGFRGLITLIIIFLGRGPLFRPLVRLATTLSKGKDEKALDRFVPSKAAG